VVVYVVPAFSASSSSLPDIAPKIYCAIILKSSLFCSNLWLNHVMRWIYLSPHLDDAALSAGGLIYDQVQSGTPVEIWTLMSGYPPEGEFSQFAQLQHYMWGFPSAEAAVSARREEDRRAAGILGARPVHFDFLDCIYRRGSNGEWLYSDISVPAHEEDAALPDQIASALLDRLQPEDTVVCPLAIGSHVDHILVRQGAEKACLPLLYDIDMPYFLSRQEEFDPSSAGMKETVQAVTDVGLEAWQEAVLEYKSQLPLFGEYMYTPDKAREALQAYRDRWGGIPILQFG
jgi:LmbE family N-acetylglucosaminyl deacetylase